MSMVNNMPIDMVTFCPKSYAIITGCQNRKNDLYAAVFKLTEKPDNQPLTVIEEAEEESSISLD